MVIFQNRLQDQISRQGSAEDPHFTVGETGVKVVLSTGCNHERPIGRDRDVAEFHGCLDRSEEHTSELQSHSDLVCRLLLEKKKKTINIRRHDSKKEVQYTYDEQI